MNSNKNTFFGAPEVAILYLNVDDSSMHCKANDVSVAPDISSKAIFSKSLMDTRDY
jgi:hypothetical protein